jgi:hypothetical protein
MTVNPLLAITADRGAPSLPKPTTEIFIGRYVENAKESIKSIGAGHGRGQFHG